MREQCAVAVKLIGPPIHARHACTGNSNHLNCATPSYRHVARDAAVFGRCHSYWREASWMQIEIERLTIFLSQKFVFCFFT